MICHKQRCVFVHIPKTAGQSIEQYFYDLNGISEKRKHTMLVSKNADPSKGPSRLAHMRAHEYVDYGHISAQQYKQYFSFAFVRNPWARLVSEYLHKKLDNKYTFKQFVFEGFPSKNDFSDAYRHVIPQIDFILNNKGEQIVNFVGRFENLTNDFRHVCQALKLESCKLPHKNSTSSRRRSIERKVRHLFRTEKRIKKHYTEYYDQETIDKVADLYKSDIERFAYDFDGYYAKAL